MRGNQFRRFTFYSSFDDEKFSELFTSDVLLQLKSIDKIQEFNVYQKDKDYFFVIDVDETLDSKKVFDLLAKTDVFKNIKSDFPNSEEALERIYKLDQKAIYKSTEGQLKTVIAPYKRFVWTLLLEPNLIDEYKRIHSIGMAWPEITANMKSVGVKDMEIYIHKEQVMLIMDTIPDFDLDKVGPKWQKLPREEEWQKYVSKFQKTDPENSIQEKWQDMKLIS